jgi:hypothetical protein
MTNRKMTWLLSFVLGALLTAANLAHADTVPAYFVSPQGTDSNNGESPAAAFQTLARAQNAMRDSIIKTTYLMGGIYQSLPPLQLDTRDEGETWQAYPGQTPILDGGNTVPAAIIITTDKAEIQVNNITLRGLVLRNYKTNAITVWMAKNITIESNVVYNIAGIAILFNGGISNSSVSHNLVYNITWRGIQLANDTMGHANHDVTIDRNIIRDTNKTPGLYDTGAIYINDRLHAETGITITNNQISNYGDSNASVGARAIYLDDEVSNVVVQGNFIFGTGGWGFQIHGGDHNQIGQNIFDLSAAAQGIGVYQDDVSAGFANFGMAANSFTGNIIYQSCTGATKLGNIWFYRDSTSDGIAALGNENNRYINIDANAITHNKIPDKNPAYTANCAPLTSLYAITQPPSPTSP